jgi:Domain of unknown function (DUF1905)
LAHLARPVAGPSDGGDPGRHPDHRFRISFMARGAGTHMLPIKAEIRRGIGDQAGDDVTVRLEERLDR